MNFKYSNVKHLKNPILKPIAPKGTSSLNSRVNQGQNQQKQQKRPQHYFVKTPSLDPRDIKLDIPSSEIENLFTNDFSDTQKITFRKWLVAVYQNICSDAFNRYHCGQLTQSQVKAYAAKNIIFNIDIVFQKMSPEITQNTRRAIMRFLNKESEQIFKQIILKYPQATIQGTYRKLKHKILRLDHRTKQAYDLIRYCDQKIKFQQNKQQDYISQVMRFINYLINLPSSPVPEQNSSQFTMFQAFQMILETLIYFDDQNHSFEQRLCKYLQMETNFSVESFRLFFQRYHSEQNQQKRKLKMNQKINASTLPFTQQEIKQGQFRILDAPILRIMDKWVEQLQQKIKSPNITFNDFRFKFKLRDGSQSQLEQRNLLNLIDELKKSQDKVRNYQSQIKKLSVDMQQTLFQQKYQGKYINNVDTNVGIIAARTQSSIGQFMLQYLNKLISILVSTPKRLSQNRIYKMCTEDSQIQLMKQLSLVTFKVGDIMRARCKASQQAIISIFKSMQALSQKLPNIFKLIRVKDRLEKKDNDILINFFFMSKVQCEIQFSVISGQVHPKQQHLNSFNHFVYELSRTKFGPIAECACIATQYDPLSKSFASRKQIMPQTIRKQITQKMENQFQLLPPDKRKQIIEKSNALKKNKMNVFPFICSVCKTYIKNFDPLSFNQKIYSLQYKQCNQCYIQRFLQKNSQSQFIHTLFGQKFSQKIQILKNHLTLLNSKPNLFNKFLLKTNQRQNGFALRCGYAKKKGKSSEIFYFKVTQILNVNQGKLLFIRFESEKMQIFYELQLEININGGSVQDRIKLNYQEFQKFFNQYLIFSLEAKDHLNLFQHKSAELANEQQMPLVIYDNQNFFYVDTIKCSKCETQRTQLAKYKGECTKVADKFQNLKELRQVIDKGKQQYQGNYKKFSNEFNSITTCKFLKILRLNQNNISDLSFLEKLPNLVRLEISDNKVQKFPDLSRNTKLAYILCKQNPIKSLQPLKDLRQLLCLETGSSCFQNFKGLENCKNLRNLIAKNSINLKTLDGLQMCEQLQLVKIQKASEVQNLQKLKNCKQITRLEILDFPKLNNIKQINNMSKLSHLSINNSPLQSLQGVQDCSNLKQIIAHKTKINSIKLLGNLQKLAKLRICASQIQTIDISGKINITSADFLQNKIKSLQGIQNFPQLQVLNVNMNKISSLSPVRKLSKLKQLHAQNNCIEYLKDIGPIKTLTQLIIGKNPLKSLAGIQQLQSLEFLGTQFKDLQSIQQLKHLPKLVMINGQDKAEFQYCFQQMLLQKKQK